MKRMLKSILMAILAHRKHKDQLERVRYLNHLIRTNKDMKSFNFINTGFSETRSSFHSFVTGGSYDN